MDGYHQLATVIGTDRDLAIFRRFSVLNAKSLLYMQGELTHLEAQLQAIAHKDKDPKKPEMADFEFCIQSLKYTHDCEDGDVQWRKVLEIRQLLREYNKALHRFSNTCMLEEANKADLQVLRDWLTRRTGGHCFLQGREADIWSDVHEKDLVSLTARSRDKDLLSNWVDLHIIPFYHKILGHRIKDPVALLESAVSDPTPTNISTAIYHYSHKRSRTVINIFSTILSSLLPTMCIFALYFIHAPLARLGTIVAFTVLFAAVLAILGRASRVECFAATTAFAAVQVVFVGNTNMTN